MYLPPGYNETKSARYPVLYMHDGQNLFDAATAFAHQEWGLDELVEGLIGEGIIEPLIIVGIYNAGEKRSCKPRGATSRECPRNCVGMSELESHAFYDKQREVTRASDWS